jgi:hypothetical protein
MSLLSDLARARRANNLKSRPFIVRRLTKSGAVSNMRPSYRDHHATYEEARKTVARLEQLNPGARFVVTGLGGAILVHVECPTANDYRWLMCAIADGNWAQTNGQNNPIKVFDFNRFTEALRSANGKVL